MNRTQIGIVTGGLAFICSGVLVGSHRLNWAGLVLLTAAAYIAGRYALTGGATGAGAATAGAGATLVLVLGFTDAGYGGLAALLAMIGLVVWGVGMAGTKNKSIPAG